jgi:hypothetical protein
MVLGLGSRVYVVTFKVVVELFKGNFKFLYGFGFKV